MSPDNRQHRGPHPADKQLFAVDQLPVLRRATSELSWLLSHEYTMKASLKLVGDRHGLSERQRLAVSRAACSDESLAQRRARGLPVQDVREQTLIVDGFNVIITTEAALSGGVLLGCRDGCIRDLSSVHGSYRSVQETDRAINLIGETLNSLGPASVRWLLDRPISNSGRLAHRIKELAAAHGWPWSVEVVFNPDTVISSSSDVALTTDSIILDAPVRWINFNGHMIKQHLSHPWILDLGAQ